MSKSYRIVKDFEFPSDKGFSGSAGQQIVKGYARGGKTCGMCEGGKAKAYAHGGKVRSDMKQDKAIVKKAVHKHEDKMHPGKPKTEFAFGGSIRKSMGKIDQLKAKMDEAKSRNTMRANPGFDTPTGNMPNRSRLMDKIAKVRGIANAKSRAPAHAAVQNKTLPQQNPRGGLGEMLERGRAMRSRLQGNGMGRGMGARGFNKKPLIGD